MTQELIVYYGTVLKKYKGEYYCNGAFGRYIDELSKKLEKVYLILPTENIKESTGINEYKIKANNIVIQELPFYKGYISALKNRKIIKRSIKEYSKVWKSPIYIRWPVPFFSFVFKLSKRKNLHTVFHLVGDPLSIVSGGVKYKGILKVLAVLFAQYNSTLIKNIIKKTPTLVNGNGLRRLYDVNNPKIKEIRTSTFQEKEIVSNKKIFGKNSVNILYVGYLRHEKGVLYLLEALRYLININENIYLTIVGTGEMENELITLTNELDLQKHVDFKGFIPIGEKLFKEYEKHDIFILPSISEGTPRVLLEAMSKGLAIVATNVGGIPFTIKNGYNGLLVNPKNSIEIKDAIQTLIENHELRERLRENSIQFAKENTIEKHILEVLTFIGKNNIKKFQ